MAMRTEKLHLLELLDFEPDQGVIRLRDQRMLLMGAAAMGWLRKELVNTLGVELTRRLLMRFGYADGYHDAISLREHRRWTDPLDELRAGIALHILEGIVYAEPGRLMFDPARRRFSGTIVWRNSHEAEQHLYHHGRSDIPVCWTLVGYVSGLASACLATEVYFVEGGCAGQGSDRCVLEGRDAASWGAAAESLHDDFRGADLRGAVDRLRASVPPRRRSRNRAGSAREAAEREAAQRHARARQFIARSAAMRSVLELALRVAPLDTTVLIDGESGTGKEFIARMIHELSARVRRPLVSINCAALAETLLESELFGHVRGAFTGATRDKPGLFEQAEGGTLFLDEIGEMGPLLQAKLLRALQEREVRRVGADRATRVDVRVVAATNRDLRQAAERGDFREDLYFRIAGFRLTVPPLRDRREDIPPLVYAVLTRTAERLGKPIRAVSSGAMSRLTAYDWPGNVRELEHVIERAVILARSSRIGSRDLPPEVRARALHTAHLNVRSHEERLIREALTAAGGNRRKAAAALGISTVTLWRRLKKLNVSP
jgi:DNA-binding NtrC family response regulator